MDYSETRNVSGASQRLKPLTYGRRAAVWRTCSCACSRRARRVPGAFEQLRRARPPASVIGYDLAAVGHLHAPPHRRSSRAPDLPRPPPSSAAMSSSLAVTHGMPSATQLPKKMSANDSPTIALMPQRCSACGACSRDEPQPKFLLTDRDARPLRLEARIVHDVPLRMPLGVEARVVEGVLPHAFEGHRLHVARRNDAVGVDVVAAQRNRPAGDLGDAMQLAHLLGLESRESSEVAGHLRH